MPCVADGVSISAEISYNAPMAQPLKRFGIWLILLIAVLLTGFGVWFINELINNVWVVPTDSPDFNAVRRSVMIGTADASVIMRSADRGMLAIFIGCVVVIGTGIALPIVYLVNRRMELTRRAPLPSLGVLFRQAFWFGVWSGFCVWLQMGRTFGLPVALLLAVVFVLFEVLFHVRRQSATLSAAD